MKEIKFEKFTNHKACLDYLDEELSNKRYKGIYIEATDNKIRPGMGLLYARLKKHSSSKPPRTKKLKNFYGEYIIYILVIPLMEYYDENKRFICDSELSYLETKLIELIEEKSKKKNLANKFYKEGDLHETQIVELDKLFKKIIRWINKEWEMEFYGKA